MRRGDQQRKEVNRKTERQRENRKTAWQRENRKTKLTTSIK